MYLTIEQCDVLDGICNRYEVALRSYVSDIIIRTFTEQKFIDNLHQISTSFSRLPSYMPMYSQKYKSKASSLANTNTYNLIKNAKKSYDAQEVVEGDVHTLGKLIDLIVLLYNPLFSTLGSKFDSVEKFIDLLNTYHDVRNNLSHIASAKIQFSNSEKLLDLINRTIPSISNDYFWFSSKINIKNHITSFIKVSVGIPTVINNLNNIPKKHKELLLREREMLELKKLICGDSEFGRVAGSAELHGYGGVGKTTLALEFCYELLRNEMNNKGQGYNFVLWMSSKTEELTFNTTTGALIIKDITPLFEKCEDILTQLSNLLGYSEIRSDLLIKELHMNRAKGLIVLDNLETIKNEEKKKIKELIRRFPRNIQFIITSRNFESIGEENIQINGFTDVGLGKEFIEQYLTTRSQPVDISIQNSELLVKHSFGNTLIIVLGLERMIDGTVSFDQLIEELQVYKESEIEIIVDFMYKNTFDTALKELESEVEGFNARLLLTVMLLYGEPIDFHSIREIIRIEDSKLLDYVLEKLANKFVLNINEGYYELQEFAAKFVVLKMLPNNLKIREIRAQITEYKRKIKENLRNLYEDKKNYSNLEPILEDWKPITEADTVAIAQAYSMHKDVRNQLYRIKNNIRYKALLDRVKEDFSIIEKRSYHPYIIFQKARILKMLLHSRFPKGEEFVILSHEIQMAYEETYFSINLKNKYLLNMESYAAFLWLYGIHLVDLKYNEEASRVLEESVERFSGLKEIRGHSNFMKVYCLLARTYALLYLQSHDHQYLQRIAKVTSDCSSIYHKNGNEYPEIVQQLILLNIFVEVMGNKYRYKNVATKLEELKQIPKFLEDIYKAIYDRIKSKRIG